MIPDINTLIDDFLKIAILSDRNITRDALSFEILHAPHTPPSILPRMKMAVYMFIWKGQCLKVGKVGPNSQARYTSQHYNPSSSNSNLAKSILSAETDLGLPMLSEGNVGAWIKSNVDRVNFLINSDCGIPVLTLLESFLQCRMKPKFEGFESQR